MASCEQCKKEIKAKKSKKVQSILIGKQELCMNKECWAKSRKDQNLDKREIDQSNVVHHDCGGVC
jgi:hypothetical protein